MMKLLICSLLLVFSMSIQAQTLPDNEDYLMVSDAANSKQDHYIFKASKQVFYAYNQDTKKAEISYKTTTKRIRTLFDEADKIDFTTLKSLPENEVNEKDADSYRIIEYRKAVKIFHIGWLVNNPDKTAQQLNSLVSAMNGFW